MTAARALLALALQTQGPSTGQPPIVIERIEPGRWRATYTFPTPVTELRFTRAAGNHRERIWRVVTPGYRWARSGDGQVLRVDSGSAPQATVAMEFPEFTAPLPKEYELFQPFTDGAVALYTGHFAATPAGPSYPDSIVPVRTVRLIPPPGAHAIVRGRVVAGAVTFADPDGDGTYIYVGTAEPIETPDLIAVVDPGMPRWLGRLLEQRLPELFAAYTRRLAASLPWKPVVLYSFHDTAAPGYSSGGGTLTGLINLTLTGSAWRDSSSEALVQAFYLLAHEAAHLWNGQLVGNEGGAGSWMHEGSADAMANDLLHGFGIIDRDTWRSRREAALNQCALQVADAPIHRAAQRGAFRTFYDCGFVMALWTEAAVRRAVPEGDLFSFWSALLRAGRANGGKYDEALYFQVARDAGVSPAATSRMQAFLSETSVEPVVRDMAAAGVDVAPAAGAPPPEFQRGLARQAFAHVMAVACRRISFNWGDPLVTEAIPECAPFNTSLRVYGLEGHRLADEGALAYDAVVAACAAGGSVRVQGRDGSRLASVPCRRALKPRPLWYELGS